MSDRESCFSDNELQKEFSSTTDQPTPPSKEDERPNSLDPKDSDYLDALTKDLLIYFKNTPPSSKEPSSNEDPVKDATLVNDILSQFNYTPKQIKTHLDDYVIGQEEAKKILSIAICDHYHHLKKNKDNTDSHYQKQNILLIGPTGVGKTYLIQILAKLIGVPFIKSDATKFSETGYQGNDVDDLIRQLFSKANDTLSLAECGIVFIDEADKLAGKSSQSTKDVNGRGVQSSLLKLMEDTDIPANPPWDINSQLKGFMSGGGDNDGAKKVINTKNILFILGGSFDGLNEIISKRTEQSNYGFSLSEESASKEKQPLSQVSTEDLYQYGFDYEFIGRLPVRAVCHALSEEDLCHIITQTKHSILDQYKESFANYGLQVLFSDCALGAICQKAHKEKTGARGIGNHLESVLRPFKFQLPGSPITQVLITAETVAAPEEALTAILKDSSQNVAAFFKLLLTLIQTHPRRSGIPLALSTTEEEIATLMSFVHQANAKKIPIESYLNTEIIATWRRPSQAYSYKTP